MCRYCTYEQLKSINKSWTLHVATKKSLQQLVALNFLSFNQSGAFYLQEPAFKFLEINKVNINHYTRRLQAATLGRSRPVSRDAAGVPRLCDGSYSQENMSYPQLNPTNGIVGLILICYNKDIMKF